jgi:hypothetical protein
MLPSQNVSSTSLKSYEGYYKTGGGNIVSIFSKGPDLYLERIGRTPFRLLPKSDNTFLMSGFYLLRGEVTFSSPSGGPASSLVIKQNDETITGTRITSNDPAVIQMQDILSKVSSASRTPGSQEAIIDLINRVRDGSVDVTAMEPRSAKSVQELLPKAQADLRKLGAIRKVEFQGVEVDGTDVYLIRFAQGWAAWNIGLARDKKQFGISYQLQ